MEILVNSANRSGRKEMSKLTLLAAFAFSVGAFSARADILYNFSFTPTSTLYGTEIEAFSFSFTVPAFVTSGESPAFSPVTMTDGVNSATLTGDLAENAAGLSCFTFATAANATLYSDCGTGLNPPNGGSFVADFEGASLPTAVGTYTTEVGDAVFYYGPGGGSTNLDSTYGKVVMTVSSVPEPSSVILTASMLLAVALWTRKKIAHPEM